MRLICGVLATFVACASLVKAESECWWVDPSWSCDIWWPADGNWFCNQHCRAQGDASGSCVARENCPYDYQTCVCAPASKREIVEDDVEVEVKEFIRAKTSGLGDEAQAEVEEFLGTLTEKVHGDGDGDGNNGDGDHGEAQEFLDAMKKHIDGNADAEIEDFLGAITAEDSDFFGKVEARDALEKKSITCPAPWVPGWICHAHCWKIGKSGGACNGIDNVCVCYQN